MITVRPSDILSLDSSNLPPYERKSIDFCREWVTGKSSFVITTSGSTGAPKTIELKREEMIASANKTIAALDLQEGMMSMVCLDTNFVAGKMMLVRSMVAGMKMIIMEPSSNPLEGFSEEVKINFAAFVPYQLATMLSSPQRSMVNAIDKIIIGGSSIGTELMNDIQNLNAQCYATFGMTETLTHIALQKLNGPDRQDFFEALAGVDISVDDRRCLIIKADYLDKPIVTNDIVELMDAQKFRWLGRWDNVINSGGIKVMPEKIEGAVGHCMLSQQLTNKFFVAGLPHKALGSQVVLVIEGMITSDAEKELMKSLNQSLHKYEIPKEVLYANAFTYTATQKIDRLTSLKNALPRPGL